jgi:hypothetical protein
LTTSGNPGTSCKFQFYIEYYIPKTFAKLAPSKKQKNSKAEKKLLAKEKSKKAQAA